MKIYIMTYNFQEDKFRETAFDDVPKALAFVELLKDDDNLQYSGFSTYESECVNLRISNLIDSILRRKDY